MNKSMIAGSLIGAAAVTAGGVSAVNYYQEAQAPQYAEIVAVTAQHKTVQEPKQYCEDVVITEQAEVKDENRVTGTIAGALIGGILGNQVGGGSGQKLATVAGAAAGAYAGNKVQENVQQNNTTTRTEQQCTTRLESRKILTGYEVQYRIGEEAGSTIVENKPTAQRYEIEGDQPQFNKPITKQPSA
jgi:uncharacterized protein YcfJ